MSFHCANMKYCALAITGCLLSTKAFRGEYYYYIRLRFYFTILFPFVLVVLFERIPFQTKMNAWTHHWKKRMIKIFWYDFVRSWIYYCGKIILWKETKLRCVLLKWWADSAEAHKRWFCMSQMQYGICIHDHSSYRYLHLWKALCRNHYC